MNFQDEIVQNFNFLCKDYDFKTDKYNSDEELSDFLVVAVGKKISLKFIKDRADFFLDVSSNSRPDNWISFYKVLERLKESGLLKEDFKPVNKLNSVKSYLKKHIDVIIENADKLIR